MTEQSLKLQVVQYLRASGFFTLRVNSGFRGGVMFYWWKMPENWSDYVSFDDIAEIYGASMNVLELQEFLENLTEKNQTDGFLDIVAWKPGLPAIVVDTKTLTGVKRKKQKLMVRILRRMGCISGFVRSVDECHRLILDWTEAEAERVRANSRPVSASSDFCFPLDPGRKRNAT